jgi:hypothetical protein
MLASFRLNEKFLSSAFMHLQNKQQTDFIKMVANRLAKNFMAPLFELTKEKGQSAQIGCLAEILDWSKEFYDQYYDKVLNREMSRSGSDNIYNAFTRDDLVISFGREKLKKFCTQNENHTNYFIKRYAAI